MRKAIAGVLAIDHGHRRHQAGGDEPRLDLGHHRITGRQLPAVPGRDQRVGQGRAGIGVQVAVVRIAAAAQRQAHSEGGPIQRGPGRRLVHQPVDRRRLVHYAAEQQQPERVAILVIGQVHLPAHCQIVIGVTLQTVLPDLQPGLDPLAQGVQSLDGPAGSGQIEIHLPPLVPVRPTAQLPAVQLAEELPAPRAGAALGRKQDVPPHAVDGILLQDLAGIGFNQLQVAGGIQADPRGRREQAVGSRCALNEIAAHVGPHVLPVPVERYVPEGRDPPPVQLRDGPAEPVALHPGKPRSHAGRVSAVAVMRHGHDDHAVAVRPAEELGIRRRVGPAQQLGELCGPPAHPAPVQIELPEAMAGPLGPVVCHASGGRQTTGRRPGPLPPAPRPYLPRPAAPNTSSTLRVS